jgi:acyl carrier protein
MTRQEFLSEMDDILEMPRGTLRGPEKLENLEQWNSVAMISFLALADTNNGVRLAPRQIVNCVTIDDLLNLAKVESAGRAAG